jgi:hypothetical protein
MKVFHMQDSDGSRETILCATDLSKALQLFIKAYKSTPEMIKQLSEDRNLTIIVEGFIEPEYSESE